MNEDGTLDDADAKAPAPAQPTIAYYGFSGIIDPDGVTRVAGAINHAVNNGYGEVYLCFSSMGGYVADGIYLYNHIRAAPIPVTMHNIGSVSSIAVAVFVAGGARFCSRHSMFMIHPTTIRPGAEGLSAERLDSTLRAALADDQRTEEILRERTSMPEDALTSRRFKDVHIEPSRALEWGLVQGVREFTLPWGCKVAQI